VESAVYGTRNGQPLADVPGMAGLSLTLNGSPFSDWDESFLVDLKQPGVPVHGISNVGHIAKADSGPGKGRFVIGGNYDGPFDMRQITIFITFKLEIVQ